MTGHGHRTAAHRPVVDGAAGRETVAEGAVRERTAHEGTARQVEVHQALVTPATARHCAGLLDAAEHHRAARLPAPAAARFTVARGLLRAVLARRLALPPPRVPLVAHCPGCGAQGHGPVRLAGGVGGATGWTLSIAHSGILVAVAVGHRAGAVGVDVETAERAEDIEALAPRLLGPGHRERLARLPVQARRAALLRVWTGAESYAKATGTGLGRALARVRTAVDAEGRVCVTAPDEPAGWAVRTVPAHAPGYAAAVTVRHGTRVRTHLSGRLCTGSAAG
ncbi:4'-phosphopantetheinyl transferase superfamily protein [Streptomyces albofaciens JCM 4342]|uniref:4'-phosphopantetheinyl transferase family protein n=1 Tax=Streptomyces albofaciens TaxID=66866 RepID=UPI00123BDD5A|nr:4'-phosphopantetheinyl transferase superfamily protein [Streptomyces albofaciens]KAA6213153.1 4'-phosphopantetheinyl transferase superfamily protein [Streptomyces albofaciens JCM 4342]